MLYLIDSDFFKAFFIPFQQLCLLREASQIIHRAMQIATNQMICVNFCAVFFYKCPRTFVLFIVHHPKADVQPEGWQDEVKKF